MENESVLPRRQKLLYRFALVCRVVVQNDVEDKFLGISAVQPLEEGDEVERLARIPAVADDPTRGYVERGKQSRRPVSVVVVCLAFRNIWPKRKDRLASLQGLDLRLLVHTENYGIFWRTQAQTDHIVKFLLEVGIVAELRTFD